MNEKWMKEITAKVIPKKYQELVNIIGVEGLLNISRLCGGTMFMYQSMTA